MKKINFRKRKFFWSVFIVPVVCFVFFFCFAHTGYARESFGAIIQQATIRHTNTNVSAQLKATFHKTFQSQPYVQGEAIVKFKKDKLDIKTLFGKAQMFVFGLHYALKNKDELGNSNSQLFTSDKSTEELIRELQSDPDVQSVQPNYQYQPAVISTNDTYKARLWGLDNTGQTVNGTAGTADADIDAPEAWALSSGNSNLIVAIIDTGVAYNHPDLSGNMWDGTNCVDENGAALGGCNHGYDFEDNDKTPLPDSSSHGTHVAGTIAALMNNNKGTIGVAPHTKIMALKSSLTTAEIVKAISFAQNNGAKIINASWGGSADDTVMKSAIDGFNGLFIAAAGNGDSNGIGMNNDSTPMYPCAFDSPNIICVAATDQNDALASFSNYGATTVDVGAPGTNIYSTVADTTVVNETFDELTAPAIPTGWVRGGTGNNWGTYSFGGSVGNVLYADLAYPYANNADTNVTSPQYSLIGYTGASISFATSCDTEYTLSSWADYMELEYSADGVNFSPAIDPYTGLDFQWNEPFLDLLNGDSNPTGSAFYYFENVGIPTQYLTGNFKFRIRWVTNASDNAYDGCWVKDVSISKFSDGSDELYGFMDGTSMATPHVVGLAALLWEDIPTFSAAQVKARILQTGDSIPALSGKTVSGKRINAFNALNGLDHPPVSVDGAAVTDEDSPVVITLSGSDTDPGDTLTYSVVSGPSHGTLGTITGNQVTYTPGVHYFGSDSFTFKVNDGTFDSNVSTVSLTITKVNSPPTADDMTVSTQINNPLTIDLSAEDDNGDPLTFATVSGTLNGTLSAITDNQITYTPNQDYLGPDSFTFKVNDGTFDSNVATVSITVNQPPVISYQTNAPPSQSSVTITWTTDHPSTSRVIYDTVPHTTLDVAPNYGYAYSTEEADDYPKVTSHSVTINGLNPSTLYFYRSVSHGSPETVGDEGNFLTLVMPTDAPSQNSSSNNAGPTFSSSTNAPVCGDTPPITAPDLFQINTNKTTATLFFTPIVNTETFYISYSTNPSAEEHGAQITLAREGVQNFTVQLLKAKTTYYFKVRGQNGCMPGNWSNILLANTQARFVSKAVPYYEHGSQKPYVAPLPVPKKVVKKPATPNPVVTSPPQSSPVQQTVTNAPQQPPVQQTVQPAPQPPVTYTEPPIPTPTPKKTCFLIWCW
jgi:subtilisin family serine protease